MFKYITLPLLLLIFNNSRSQSDPSKLFEEFYSSIQKSDTANFIKWHVPEEQVFQITKGYILGDLNVDSIKAFANIPNSKGTDSFYKSILTRLWKKSDSSGIDISRSTYYTCRYQLIRSPENFFTSLNGDIIFKYEYKYYALPINEAILIGDQWKIISTGAIEMIKDTTSLLTRKLSALQTIEKGTKISSIKVSKVEDKDQPPPPPPPKIIRSKPH